MYNMLQRGDDIMKLEDNEQIRKIIRQRLVNTVFKHYLYFKRLQSEDYSRIDSVIGEILNLDIKTIIPLNEDETYVIRKKLGILDNGKGQRNSDIINHQFNLPRTISNHFNRGCVKLFDRVTTDFKESNFNRLSPLDIFSNVPNFDIYSLDFNSKTVTELYHYNIRTVRDLLSFSSNEYQSIGLSLSQIQDIQKNTHKYGLKFIDELNLDEKSNLIMK